MITAVGPVGTGGIANSAVTTPKLSEPAAIKRMCSGVIGGNIPGEIVTLGKITTPIMITNIDLFVGELGLTGNLQLDVGWVDDLGAGAAGALVAAFPPGVLPAVPTGTVIPVPGVPIPVAGPAAPATAVMLTASALAPDGAGERVQVGIEYYELEEAP